MPWWSYSAGKTCLKRNSEERGSLTKKKVVKHIRDINRRLAEQHERLCLYTFPETGNRF